MGGVAVPYDYTDQEDAEGFSIMRVVAAVIASLLLIAAVGAFVLDDAPREADQPAATVDTSTLAVRTNNAAEMHRYGLPTKEDVMEWHYSGQWGYKAGTSYYVYADLPGESAAWDELYGIDPDNPAFDK